MKRLIWTLLALTLVLPGVTACGTAPQPAEPPASDQAASPETAAFRAALERFETEHLLPDGSDSAYDESFGPLSDNRFAVYDVDGDGADELIFSYTTAPEAGKLELVYGLDASTGALTAELTEYPALTYLSNGMIRAKWSHNQGLAGDAHWPYTLYAYDAAGNRYVVLATVDTWDRAVSETNFEGQSFPAELDTDQSGVVFFLTQEGVTRTLSQTDYTAWLEETLGGAEEVSLPYLPMTAENIAALQ